jgi:hypothetical protein
VNDRTEEAVSPVVEGEGENLLGFKWKKSLKRK